MKISEIAKLVHGEVEGQPDLHLQGLSKIEEGKEGTLTFLGNLKYEKFIYETEADAILVPKSFQARKKINSTLIRVDNVYEAMAELLRRFEGGETPAKGIHDTAHVDSEAEISGSARIGAFVYIAKGATLKDEVIVHPHVYIGPDVQIGEGTVLYPGVKVMHDCVIGKDCIIHPNTVIGSDGFGFAQNEEGVFSKINQSGNVIVEDQVEIGACATIDRASIGSTIIGQGCKIDNQVQVAHNVRIGKNTAIAAQAGIAGSTQVGEQCLIGGQAGLVGHIKVDDRTQIQAQSGVASSTKETDGRLYGTPALDYNTYLRSYVSFSKLSHYVKKIEELEKRIAQLEADEPE